MKSIVLVAVVLLALTASTSAFKKYGGGGDGYCHHNLGISIELCNQGLLDGYQDRYFYEYEICSDADGPNKIKHVTFGVCHSYLPKGFGDYEGCDEDSHLCFLPGETEACCDDQYDASTATGEGLKGYGYSGGNCDVRVGRDYFSGQHGVKIHKRFRFDQYDNRCTKVKLVFHYDQDRHADLPDLNEDDEDAFKPMEVTFRKHKKCSTAVVPGLGCDHTCFDNIQNQGETGVDCGGPCPKCEIVHTCAHYFNYCLFDPYKFMDQEEYQGKKISEWYKYDAPKCPEGFLPISEDRWYDVECELPSHYNEGTCQQLCCEEELNIPDCPENYCPTQHAESDTSEVCLDPAAFITEPDCEADIPTCDISTQTTQSVDPSVMGGINPFFDDNMLPAGTYRAVWHDGCMKYNGGQWWAVNARDISGSGVTYKWWVAANDGSGTLIWPLPGTVGFKPGNGCAQGDDSCSGDKNGFETYEECLAANAGVAPSEFDLVAASKLGSFLSDTPYTDNISGSSVGGIGPVWTLQWVGTCEEFQAALASLP